MLRIASVALVLLVGCDNVSIEIKPKPGREPAIPTTPNEPATPVASLPSESAESGLAAQIDRFEVSDVKLIPNPNPLIDVPLIHMRVHNRTDYVISTVYMRGRLVTPGRTIPWVNEDCNYEIPGGIEVGESAQWMLQPNIIFGNWDHTPEDLSGTVFTLTVVNLEGVLPNPRQALVKPAHSTSHLHPEPKTESLSNGEEALSRKLERQRKANYRGVVRDWNTEAGTTISNAELRAFDGETVYFRQDSGEILELAIGDLSDQDMAIVHREREWQGLPEKP